MRFSTARIARRFLPQRLALAAAPLLDAVDAALFASDERGIAGRMSLIAFAIRIVSALIAFASQVILARWMGGFEYGIFVLVWVSMILAGNLSCLGFHTSVVRFVPEYREKGMLAELRGILVASRIFVIICSSICALLGAVCLFWIAPSIEPYYLVPFLYGLILVPMIALSDMLQGLARANSWALSALSPTYLVRPVLILVAVVGAVRLGMPATAETALIASIAATYLTTVIQFFGVTTRLERAVEQGARRMRMREWIAISLPIFLVESFFFLLTNADVLLVGAFLEPHDVAVYFATVKTLALVHFVYFAVKAGVAQRYAQFTHGDPARLSAFARETANWTFWPSLALGVLLLAVGKPVLSLFGPGFEAGYLLLYPLVAGVVLRASVGPAESLLTMSGNHSVCALIYGTTLAINIAVTIALIPQLGLWGAAIGTTAAMVFEAIALAVTVSRKLGIDMAIAFPARNAKGAF